MTKLLLEDLRGKMLQKRHLEALVRNKAFEFTDTFFPYTSGEIGPYYVQSAAILANGADYSKACQDLSYALSINFRADLPGDLVISGGETRDWMFSLPIAVDLGIPHAMIYKDGKILGADVKGKEVIHIADLNNEGSSPRDHWIPAIRKAGGIINDIVFFVDRLEEGKYVMDQLQLNSYAMVPLDLDAWTLLKTSGTVNQDTYNSLVRRMVNKNEWARQMLKSDKGIARLVQLFDDPRSREKVRKILDKGYPDMKPELLEVLNSRSQARIDISEWDLKK